MMYPYNLLPTGSRVQYLCYSSATTEASWSGQRPLFYFIPCAALCMRFPSQDVWYRMVYRSTGNAGIGFS